MRNLREMPTPDRKEAVAMKAKATNVADATSRNSS